MMGVVVYIISLGNFLLLTIILRSTKERCILPTENSHSTVSYLTIIYYRWHEMRIASKVNSSREIRLFDNLCKNGRREVFELLDLFFD